jgi:hypothetical protein
MKIEERRTRGIIMTKVMSFACQRMVAISASICNGYTEACPLTNLIFARMLALDVSIKVINLESQLFQN